MELHSRPVPARLWRLAGALALALALAPGATRPAAADTPPPSCERTAEQALEPFRGRLAAAEAGLAAHGEASDIRARDTEAFIAALQADRALFEERRAEDMARHAARIAAAEEAIAAIEADVARERAALAERLAEARAAGRQAEADRLAAALAALSARHAAGEVAGYAPPLGSSRSTAGWRAFLAEEIAAREASAASHAAGEVAVYVPRLGQSPTWRQVEARIAAEYDRLAATLAREDAVYAPTLGRSFDGAGIDALVAQRQEELADALARIGAGTFALYVPTLGRTTDRNAVLALVAEAEAALASIRRGWDNGGYAAYNPMAGRTIAKAEIDRLTALARAALADYIAAGDDAAAYVPSVGRTITGRELRRLADETTTAELRSRRLANYRDWQEARDRVLASRRAEIDRLVAMLGTHRDLWLAEIARREDDIAGRLARALAETPCGGTAPPPADDPLAAFDGDATWEGLRGRCRDLAGYQASSGALRVSQAEYMTFLRVLEAANPGLGRQQLVAALHNAFHGTDRSLALPILGVPLFHDGPDTDGWEGADLVCTVSVGSRDEPFLPKFVYLDNGEEVDVSHVYAGVRSDLNRRDMPQFWRDFMLNANTSLGDYWQVYFDDPDKFPMNQLRGDMMGIWLARFYREPANRDLPLSAAMVQLLAEVQAAGGAAWVMRPPR